MSFHYGKNILTYSDMMNVIKPYEYCREYLCKCIIKLLLMEKERQKKPLTYIVFNASAIFPIKPYNLSPWNAEQNKQKKNKLINFALN